MRYKNMIPLTVFLIALMGCATVQQGNDPVVVNAERSALVAQETFNSLFRVEMINHALLKESAPQVVKGVNKLRVEGPKAIDTLTALTRAYKHNHNAENKATLETALSTVEELIRQARKYLTQIGGQ